jgi:hypothetical protein
MVKPYTKTFVCDVTGIRTTYTYNGNSIVSGIIKAEFDYPSGYLEAFNKKEKRQDSLPKTKRLYNNPATGRDVSYARAKALKII